jgi:hypothetical protein
LWFSRWRIDGTRSCSDTDEVRVGKKVGCARPSVAKSFTKRSKIKRVPFSAPNNEKIFIWKDGFFCNLLNPE